MFKRIWKNNRGSTLVLVLVSMSVLSLLGTVILSSSLVNLKLKISERNVKTGFYLTESGLEEAYAIVRDQVNEGIEAGNNYVTMQLNNFIENERRRESEIVEPPETPYVSPYLKADGSIDENACKVKMEEWFKDGYRQEMDDQLDDILGSITTRVVRADIDPGTAEVTLVGGSISPYGNSNSYTFALRSNFDHKGIERTIQMNYEIGIPAYNAPFYTRNYRALLPENILWKKTITAEGNLYITGTNVEIDGDVYVYGTKPSDPKAPASDFGGIVVGDLNSLKPGSVTISGSVDTNSYIYTKMHDSSITVNGNIFCDSLVIPENINNGNIAVTGTLHTYDDLELNGTNSSININGDYYAFSDGSANTHLQSSSIVINSPDIVNYSGVGTPTSSLRITGDTYLGGTVYINLEDGTYQTGESVSIKENYVAYTGALSKTPTIPREQKFKEDFQFAFYSPLYLVEAFHDGNPLLVMDKSKYITYYHEDYPDVLNLAGSGIVLNRIKYSTGAYVNNGSINPSKIDGSVVNFINDKYRDYKKHVYTFNDPTEVERDEANRIRISDEGSTYGKFDFTRNSSFIPPETNNYNSKDIMYINNNESKDIAIIGKGGVRDGLADTNTDIYGLSDDFYNVFTNTIKYPLKGIIVTKGDVYLRGRLNFQGIIVTEGTVYIQDDEEKVISMDHNKDTGIYGYVLRKVYEVFEVDHPDVYINPFVHNYDIPIEFIYESNLGTEDLSTYQKYEDVVKVEWQKIK